MNKIELILDFDRLHFKKLRIANPSLKVHTSKKVCIVYIGYFYFTLSLSLDIKNDILDNFGRNLCQITSTYFKKESSIIVYKKLNIREHIELLSHGYYDTKELRIAKDNVKYAVHNNSE